MSPGTMYGVSGKSITFWSAFFPQACHSIIPIWLPMPTRLPRPHGWTLFPSNPWLKKMPSAIRHGFEKLCALDTLERCGNGQMLKYSPHYPSHSRLWTKCGIDLALLNWNNRRDWLYMCMHTLLLDYFVRHWKYILPDSSWFLISLTIERIIYTVFFF